MNGHHIFLVLVLCFSSSNSIDLNINCTFQIDGPNYACFTEHLNIVSGDEVIVAANSVPSNLDVSKFKTHNKNVATYLPFGLGNVFPNLRHIEIAGVGLKFVQRQNFQNLPNLLILNLNGNKIEFLPEDLLYDLPLLEYVVLCNNPITVLPDNFLIASRNLDFFRANDIKAQVLPANFFDSTVQLTKISMLRGKLIAIRPNFARLIHIKEIHFTGNTCTNLTFAAGKMDIASFQQSVQITCPG